MEDEVAGSIALSGFVTWDSVTDSCFLFLLCRNNMSIILDEITFTNVITVDELRQPSQASQKLKGMAINSYRKGSHRVSSQ